MPNLHFENQGTNTYLVTTIKNDDEVDSMSLGMITNNEIPGLAAASFGQMDLDRFIKYNVTAKVSVTQLFSGPVNKKRLLGVFSGIVDAMLSAEDYMLDPGSLLLDLDYIFADVSTCETVLICLPMINENGAPDLGAFFKNIIFRTQFDQTENCDHVAQILNHLNSNPVFSLTAFKALLDEVKGGAHSHAQHAAPVAPVVQQTVVQQPVNPQPVITQPVAQQPVNPQPAVRPVEPKPRRENKPTANQNVGYNIPQKQEPAQPAAAADEDQMSLGYLLQHYNKENAAIYKAQQDAKKGKKGEKADKVAPQPAPAPEKQKASKQQANVGFAVPGQPEVPGFAIPGQPDVPVAQPKAQPAPQPKAQPKAQPAPQPKAQPAPQPKAVPEQPAGRVCGNCGNAMRPGQAFCTACGTRYAEPAAPAAQPVQPQVQPQVQAQPAVQPVMPVNFGETVVLNSGAIGETTVLGGAAAPTRNDPYLIRAKNNEKIPLNKPVFRIGKERSYVDYFIGDNTAISRSHANIINHNGEYFILDTNSTNHTYVNGGMIQSNEEVRLTHGTKIRLANEDFEFNLY